MEELDTEEKNCMMDSMPQPVQVLILENASPFNKIKMIASGSSALKAYIAANNPWERWILDEFNYGMFKIDKQWIDEFKVAYNNVIDGRKLFIALMTVYRADISAAGRIRIVMKYPGMNSVNMVGFDIWKYDARVLYEIILRWNSEFHEKNTPLLPVYDQVQRELLRYIQYKKWGRISGGVQKSTTKFRLDLSTKSPDVHFFTILVYQCLVAGLFVRINDTATAEQHTAYFINKAVNSCANCDAPVTGICNGCDAVGYCSRTCQKEDWNTGHHTECGDKTKNKQQKQHICYTSNYIHQYY